MMTDVRRTLAQIQTRALEATPGPWELRMRSGVAVVPGIIAATHVRLPVKDWHTNCYEGETKHELTPLFVGEQEDAVFIAHAHTDVGRMSETLESVLNVLDRLDDENDGTTARGESNAPDANYSAGIREATEQIRSVINATIEQTNWMPNDD